MRQGAAEIIVHSKKKGRGKGRAQHFLLYVAIITGNWRLGRGDLEVSGHDAPPFTLQSTRATMWSCRMPFRMLISLAKFSRSFFVSLDRRTDLIATGSLVTCTEQRTLSKSDS